MIHSPLTASVNVFRNQAKQGAMSYAVFGKNRLSRFFLYLLAGCFALSLSMSQAKAANVPVPSPPELNATSWLLMDFQTGFVMAEHNATERAEPASITKLMTLYVVFQELAHGQIQLSDEVTVSAKAWRTGGSKMFIEVGNQVKVEELLHGIIVQSGNDASVAIAEHIAGGEDTFATLMNQYAEKLGMTGTNYVNATGWPHPDHYTTAQDIAILSEALIREFPEYYAWFSEKKYKYNNIEQFNRNKLLWRDDSVDGLKTGHTEAAGFCLAASAKRDDMRLITVVLGAKNDNARAQATQSLLNYGFRFYESSKLYDANQAVSSARVWKGDIEQIPVGLAHALHVTVPRGQADKLTAEAQFDEAITAPIQQFDRVGKLNITLNGEIIMQQPLLSLQAVEKGSLWQQFTDSIMLMFE